MGNVISNRLWGERIMGHRRNKRLDADGNIVRISSANRIFKEPLKTLPPGFKTLHQYRKWERKQIKEIESAQKEAKKQAHLNRRTPTHPPTVTTQLPMRPGSQNDKRI